MRTIVFQGFTLELTEESYQRFQTELAEQQAEEERMDSICKGLAETRHNGDWDFYSDLYKDYYGVRPIGW